MIATLHGTVIEMGNGRLVVEAGGVGYEVFVTSATMAAASKGAELRLHIAESFGLYGGGASLYGFATSEEKQVFGSLREHVPGTGAKKAMEHLEKAAKSLPDFRRAVAERDPKVLSGVFGFSKKTAERIIEALKDKLEGLPAGALARSFRAEEPAGDLARALSALENLGYKPAEARAALDSVREETGGRSASAEEILRLALKRL